MDGSTYPAKPIPGQYQTGSPKVKTIYDPNIISDAEYIERGVEAANDVLSKSTDGVLPHEWVGKDSYGIEWRGYSDDGITPSSFYPDHVNN